MISHRRLKATLVNLACVSPYRHEKKFCCKLIRLFVQEGVELSETSAALFMINDTYNVPKPYCERFRLHFDPKTVQLVATIAGFEQTFLIYQN
jgi:hypothetical protein